jgi:hypothetical protein
MGAVQRSIFRGTIGENDRMHFNSRLMQPRARQCVGLLLVSLTAVAGCNDGKIRRYPVNGAVNVDSKPAAGAAVFFCPVGDAPELQKIRPMGVTGPDGKFQMTTTDRGDGAPEGKYKVLIMWPASGAPGQDGSIQMGPDRLHNRYMNLEKSELTVDVKAEANNVPPFELKSK